MVALKVLLVFGQQSVEVILPLFQHVPKILLKKHEERRWDETMEGREGSSVGKPDAAADNQQLYPPLARPCWSELYKNRTNWKNWIWASNNGNQTSNIFFQKVTMWLNRKVGRMLLVNVISIISIVTVLDTRKKTAEFKGLQLLVTYQSHTIYQCCFMPHQHPAWTKNNEQMIILWPDSESCLR